MSPHEANMALFEHLSKAIQYIAGDDDKEGGDDFAHLILSEHLSIDVTEVNGDGSFAATIKLKELHTEQTKQQGSE